MRPVFRDGRVHVLAEQCATCIFRPGNPMHLQPGRVKGMVDACRETDGGNIPCHSTLGGDRAICRGFWDAYAAEDPILRLAQALDVVEEVPLP